MRRARRDHREAVGFLGDQTIDDHRAGMVDHRLNAGVQLAFIFDADALPAVRFGQLDEIGQAVGIAFRIAAFISQFLPLADHPHPFVVEDEDLHRQAVLRRGAQFLDVHLDRGIARDVDHQTVRIAQLRADGGGQAIAHGAEAARGQPLVRTEEVEVLRRPHLVLADFGGNHRVAVPGQLEQAFDRQLRHDRLGIARIGQALAGAPAVDPGFPVRQVLRLAGAPCGNQLFQHFGAVADDRQIDRDGLVDRAAVDVDVDLGRIGRERVQPSGHPVIKARADADHQVGLVHRHVGFERAVHPQHAQPVGMVSRKRAEAHQRGGNRRAGQVLQLAQQLCRARAGIDHAAAGIEDRRAGIGQQFDRAGDVLVGPARLRVIALRLLRRRGVPAGRGDLDVLGNVDHDRTGAARGGDAERFLDDPGQFRRVLHQIVVLGAVAGDADGVGFLKRVRADQPGRDLPGDDHQRDRIHERIGNARDGIGRAGTRGDQHDAGLAGGACVPFSRVGGASFVANQNVANAGVVEQGVVNRQHRAAGIAEHEFDALPCQAFNQDTGAAALLAHVHSLSNFGCGPQKGSTRHRGLCRVSLSNSRKNRKSGC